MGNDFDTYHGVVRCPRCAAPHWIDGETKFFNPDGETQVCFVVGETCPVGTERNDLPHPCWDGQWVRVREPGRTDRVDLLVDFDDLVRCECGFALAIVLSFALGPSTAILTEIQVLDALRPDLASQIDFINTVTYVSPARLEHHQCIALAGEPVARRVEYLARCIAATFDRGEGSGLDGWTWVVGPTRCEACGDVRERRDHTWLGQNNVSFFGGWNDGGAIYLGTRVPFDDRWLAEDVDRDHYFRVRHPIATADRIVILGQRKTYGCACGAGPVAFVWHFARRPGELELVELTLRVVETLDDLADVDFVEGPTRPHFGQDGAREHVMCWMLARYRR